MEIQFLLYIFVIQFMGFFIKGLVGFGTPLFTNPFLSMILENRIITPANLLLDGPSNIYIAYKNRKGIDFKVAVPMAIAMVIGIIPGTLMLKYGDSNVLKLMLGVLVIGIGVDMLLSRKSKGKKVSKFTYLFSAAFAGFTDGVFGIGLTIIAPIERMSEKRENLRGTTCFVFSVANIIKVFIYIYGGLFITELWPVFLASAPGCFLGLYAGSRVDKKLDEKTVRLAAIAVFIFGGVSIFIKSIYGLFF